MSDAAPLARLARRISAALNDFATEVEAGDALVVVPDDESIDPAEQVSGHRQKQILSLEGIASDGGLKPGEIATLIGYEEPNVYNTLRGLAVSGIVEKVPGVSPARWRLTARYRLSSSPYVRMAGLVRPGEWTTYGDISIAVRGDTLAARAVGRSAATLESFPNPHRVLKEGGTIPSGWHTSDGRGPEICEERLRGEGVMLTDGKADPTKRIQWDILLQRGEGAA